MLLAIDIGNSTIGAGVFTEDSSRLLPLENIHTDSGRPSAWYESVFLERLTGAGLAPGNISDAVISSVVPALTNPFIEIVEKLFSVKALLVSPAIYHLLPIKMTEIRAAQIGTDIVCSAVEAYGRFRGACVIVAFGTALTFTAIGATGKLLGAAIAPGLGIALKSLASGAAQLYAVPLEVPSSPLGQDTTGAIQSGVILGAVGAAEYLVERFIIEMCRKENIKRDAIQVIATGGNSGLVAPLTGIFRHVDRDLVLHGLGRTARIIRNSA